MALVADKLSFAEFQVQYGQSERAYEYWKGDVVPKAMPTSVHGLLQSLVCQLLRQAGYKSVSDVELRIDPDYCPRPDVIATRGKIEVPYPTKAVEVVVEILSPEDSFSFALEKSDAYAGWGFSGIYLIDPGARRVYQWSGRGLEMTDVLAGIATADLWSALDHELA